MFRSYYYLECNSIPMHMFNFCYNYVHASMPKGAFGVSDYLRSGLKGYAGVGLEEKR
ncbi:hypothetical protein KDK_76050 [Dictyobacter kobayashii]|uniref:Uncharacterized protein n=1 Tax=Dictyobacter kobayashii TaxID=2014872 RepID=A0A402AXI8_9CHLR|nr:hypothetical protein KDK_76050 [Dictyobacter kobayashii]